MKQKVGLESDCSASRRPHANEGIHLPGYARFANDVPAGKAKVLTVAKPRELNSEVQFRQQFDEPYLS
jgi:hypothetical protein